MTYSAAENHNYIRELIISKSPLNNYYNEFVVYIEFKKKIDLHTHDFIKYLNLDGVFSKSSEKKGFALNYGNIIYNKIFN